MKLQNLELDAVLSNMNGFETCLKKSKLKQMTLCAVLCTRSTISEKDTIDANANEVASVRLAHRKDIQRSRKIVMSLFDELEMLGELMWSPDDKGNDKVNDLYMKIISMPGRVKSMMGDDPNFPTAEQTAVRDVRSPYLEGEGAQLGSEGLAEVQQNTNPMNPPVPKDGDTGMQGIETGRASDNFNSIG